VENFLLRTPTSYTSSVNTTNQPDLFAVDSNAVAFTRTPHEVSVVEATVLCSLYLDQQYGQWLTWFKLLQQFLQPNLCLSPCFVKQYADHDVCLCCTRS